MKRFLTGSVLTLSLALAAASPAVLAKGRKTKPSAEHIAAVKQCQETYKTANKAAGAEKGEARKDAMNAARKARKECLANAPK
ncbi:MAG TPA: hypothetical protein VF723_04635 [Pyrinomonadaceae bacterium]